MRRKQKLFISGNKFYSQAQVDAWIKYNAVSISKWPKDAQDKIIERNKKSGWSGDLLYQCLYEWILENVK